MEQYNYCGTTLLKHSPNHIHSLGAIITLECHRSCCADDDPTVLEQWPDHWRDSVLKYWALRRSSQWRKCPSGVGGADGGVVVERVDDGGRLPGLEWL